MLLLDLKKMTLSSQITEALHCRRKPEVSSNPLPSFTPSEVLFNKCTWIEYL